MILALEIALAVVGLLAIIRGRLRIAPNCVVGGTPARWLGALALSPVPLTLVMMFVSALASTATDPEQFLHENRQTFALVELGLVVFAGLLVLILGAAIGTKHSKAAKARQSEARKEDVRAEGTPINRPWLRR
jgi:hypothetical protein